MKKFSIAIVGATGVVGGMLIELLEQRRFPTDQLHLLASERSSGQRFSFRGSYLRVQALEDFDFAGIDIAFFTAGSEISALYVPRATANGAIVVDNTSKYRLEPNIPLVVPEINADQTERGLQTRIVANPNCSTIQMVVALNPIHNEVGIKRITVSTYQSVSGAGTRAIEELAMQTANVLNAKTITSEVAPVQMAFNVIPQIGEFQENGFSEEEMKMVQETQKIFDDPNIEINPTCVRVPIFFGHSLALHVETRRKIQVADVRRLLIDAPGVELVDSNADGGYPTPVTHATGQNEVFVGRVRADLSAANGLNLWVVSDNSRKGAALNSLQIAEELVQHLH
ncbi:MAG: aspartate-semialdehyde dehydrogenase [Gammaproteobacteria bacterium]|nr:aspartate-semialdehyde dehydrogenase [Gammaproteobacteria bacterium]MYF01448.1 aspartate-semialdehyde dehydrogenase [Gammaproteobacteria bacterium]MYI77119.1 aspartate-semialdehyde dehydrogenase [Gammaproteobacteria bacterium]